jgi:hypothetical protein
MLSVDARKGPVMSEKLPADLAELRGMVMEALAEVLVCSPADLVSGGQPDQLQLSQKETNHVAAAIEEITGKSELVTPADFATPKTRSSKPGKDVSPNGCMDPGEGTTVKHMVDLLARRLGLSAQEGG